MSYRKGIVLRGIDFRRVETASGVRNFFGNGYPYHYWWPWKRYLNFTGAASVAKTTTFLPREGNMPMRKDGITPLERFPRCIVIKPWSGHGLNAVGLSGPGAHNLLGRKIWQKRHGEPWWLSFMSIEASRQDRLDELREFIELLLRHDIRSWNADYGLEINVSCPNVGVHYDGAFVKEVCEMASIADMLGIPLRLKANALLDHAVALAIFKHPAWDALTMGNTIPFGQLSDKIPFEKIFGSVSPLTRRGFSSPGGYSGPCLLSINCDWIEQARMRGFIKPIWGCGGLKHWREVNHYVKAGADGVQLGSMTIHSFRQVRPTIRYANEVEFTRRSFAQKLY